MDGWEGGGGGKSVCREGGGKLGEGGRGEGVFARSGVYRHSQKSEGKKKRETGRLRSCRALQLKAPYTSSLRPHTLVA
jgi:hypothetical protein